MNKCVCAITGHRPSRFKFKYSEDYTLCKKIKANMLEVFRKLYDEKEVRCFYVGGALGVDMWAAEQILRLKEQPGYEDIELVAYTIEELIEKVMSNEIQDVKTMAAILAYYYKYCNK